MPINISISLTPESMDVLRRHVKRPFAVAQALNRALGQGLEETAGHLKHKYLSGRYAGQLRTPGMLAVRSGSLRQAVMAEVDKPLSGTVGTSGEGPAANYARVQLGDQTWAITPKSARYLWIPIADNLTKGGLPRWTPRAAMDIRTPSGKRALRIFKSKNGNLVAFVPGRIVSDKAGSKMGVVRSADTAVAAGKYRSKNQRGRPAGSVKGLLLFVLKSSVTVKGGDYLATAVKDKTPRIRELLESALHAAIAAKTVPGADPGVSGGGASGGGGGA